MEHSIALVTGATSGLGYAAARALAEEGWREIIITGRSLAEAKEAAAKLAAETKLQVFTPLELELDTLSSVQSVLAALVKRGRPVDFLLLNAGIMGRKELKLTAAGIEMSAAPLIGHHQLTVGLLRAKLLSPDARIVIAGSEAARGDVPLFSYTDLPAFAAKYYRGDRTAAVEALVAQRAEREVPAQPGVRRREAHRRVVGRGTGSPATHRHGSVRRLAWCRACHQCGAKRRPPYEVGADSSDEAYPRHVSHSRDGRPSIPPGIGVWNRRLGAILRLAAQEVHRPNRGDAPPALSRSRQPGSRVAGRRQGLRRRLVLPSILERGVLKRLGRG